MAETVVWEKSDSLLGGGAVAVRGVTLAHGEHVRAAVALSLRVLAGAFQIEEDDGSVTVTVLLGPDEGLGIGAWLRDASQAAKPTGAPLYDWT
jgi:hypothetical protein